MPYGLVSQYTGTKPVNSQRGKKDKKGAGYDPQPKKIRALNGQLKLKGTQNTSPKPKYEAAVNEQIKLDDYFTSAL